MNLIHPNSLAATLEAVEAALFFNDPLTQAQKREVALWIARRQGQSGAYAEMVAPTAGDFQKGVRLFTGEKVISRAATAHILGEEACRTLLIIIQQDFTRYLRQSMGFYAYACSFLPRLILPGRDPNIGGDVT